MQDVSLYFIGQNSFSWSAKQIYTDIRSPRLINAPAKMPGAAQFQALCLTTPRFSKTTAYSRLSRDRLLRLVPRGGICVIGYTFIHDFLVMPDFLHHIIVYPLCIIQT